MQQHTIGIILNGVTGRMGSSQHLMRSIVAIRRDGGVRLADGSVIMPRPILVGRNVAKLRRLADEAGLEEISTDLDAVLSDDAYPVYFDAQTTDRRVEAVTAAIQAGKDVYCEKPTALNSADALRLYHLAREAGCKNGVVQDKLFLPGLRKLRRLIDQKFFGRIFAVRGEFGYWVFEGDTTPTQRPSWNSRKEDGGGIILDMFSHWRYVLDNLFGRVRSVCCLGATHIHKRWDESARPFQCTADDSAYAMFELDGDIIVQFNSSWATRVRRDDLLTIQVDGTDGSAVAGLRDCRIQPASATPRPVWNPDVDQPLDFYDGWQDVPEYETYDNAFRAQWEKFLKHVHADEAFPWTLLEGAKCVQLAELATESWEKRRWVDVPPLT
ncbi:MAG: Gfo/Idh/MocA family oxidoreductase [Phycisphaerae bacterium]|nr:Gfo/Idh/MocA family oxidoreductase [Phycisphaerae bacterium]